MTVYQPQDPVISPVVAAIANIVQTQIAGVTVVYQQPPDGPPEDGSVVIPLSTYKILGDSNGKMYTKLTFGIRHFIRRGNFQENVLAAYSYWYPYMQAFSAWGNQDLGGLAQNITVSNGGVTQFVQAAQVFTALIVNLDVILEFNIPTS
ncbi:hypothetical protein [Ktedonobacter robiniae]|uniref:Uncharacterized protein n=1 Tax=Ktedonobacter robiniae TaxID=2778365 RepID=A0ABQ3UT11_9CHLR|nr:hypothetical protein [Ktedonobacter robiniae]GHO55525.1 hypothetical protein KSB_40000 [Ktedonobacter robiniae]